MHEVATGDHNVEDLTLRDLFALSPDSPVELAAGLKAEDFQTIGRELSSFSQPIPWSLVQSKVATVISAALNMSLLDAWACAWKKYQDVKADVEESRKSPEAIVLTRLVEHSIDSTLHPYVDVLLGPKKIQRITFDVTLTTHLKGLILELKDGRLVSLRVGQCEWTGSIAAQGVVLIERKLTKLDLPGRISLKRGISLGSQTDA